MSKSNRILSMDTNHHHFFLFFFYLLNFSSSQPTDMESLLEFKKGIERDPNGVLSTWKRPPADTNADNPNAVTCPSSFHGVSCDPSSTNGAVFSIELTGLGLSGEVRLSTLSSLRSLRRLSLAGNVLSGRIPPSLGSIDSLNHLDLSGNRFYGPVPSKVLGLPALSHLNLSFNVLEGGLVFDVDESSFVSQLKVLDLRSNNLSGEVAAILPRLRNLDHVDLSNNAFYGTLPAGSGNVTGFAANLKYLNLSWNVIGGGFFDGNLMKKFRSIEVVDLGGNRINGELPSLRELSNLKVFRVQDNQLFGSLPIELMGSGMHTEELDLSGNGFSGHISDINSTTLKILNLSSNSLSGPLPYKLGACVLVDLSTNMISGDLSVMNSWEDTVEHIDLSSNSLSGNLPDGKYGNLISIKIRNNSLAGSLPSALGDYPKLSVLDLSSNKLSGSISSNLFSSLTLTTLNLSGNELCGSLTLQGTHLPETLVLSSYNHLEILDLSGNFLSGSLSQEIGNMQSLRLLNLRKNSFSGVLPGEINKLNSLEFLDLSNNRLEGGIPDLPQPDLKFLNVSYNNLSGTVPKGLMRFPVSSFFPGNPLLTFSDGAPVGNDNSRVGDYNHHRSRGSVIAAIVGSVGAFMLLVFALVAVYVMKSQGFCRNSGFGRQSNRIDIAIGRFFGQNLLKPKDASFPTTASFSNDHLLISSARLAENVKYGYSDASVLAMKHIVPESASGGWKSSGLPLPSSPSFTGSCSAQQPVILDVYSPDRLVGELFFLDGSVAFTAQELSRAPAEVLGRSSHGTSYKAALDGGRVLTVKWLRVGLVKRKKEFAKEAKRIGAIIHPNIIAWRGYYWDPREQERLILSDFVEGDSLALYLHESTPRRYSRLFVNQRLKIAIDMTSGLLYLHNKGLPHGNLKPTNVLLTTPDLTARLMDYGLHRLMTLNGTEEQVLNLGALGYRAPELSETSKPLPTFKGDVYAFGVILMELLTRRSAGDIVSGQSGQIDLADWVRICAREGRGTDCFDRDINGLEDSPEVMEKFLSISLRCILPVSERPNIKTVYEDLCAITM